MKSSRNKLLLITPPLLQPNTPYPATPVLTGFLRSHGVEVEQTDLSILLLRRIFSRAGMEELAKICSRKSALENSAAARFFLERSKLYAETVDAAIDFLSGRSPELARRIANRTFLPEGPSFGELAPAGTGLDADENLERMFGSSGICDRAKLIASLYLDDIAKIITEACDPDFSFSRYAEHLAESAPSFDPLLKRLARPSTWIDRIVETLAEEAIGRSRPDAIGITIPFPGTLYFALRIAKLCRKKFPSIKIVFGGGYVNTELRSLEDKRIFDFAHQIVFDEGFEPMLGIAGGCDPIRTLNRENLSGRSEVISQSGRLETPAIVEPDYAGLDLSLYFDMVETANPMQRIWSEGKWLKLQLANGCYWGKCAFCDVSLDYIARFRAPKAEMILETMISMKRQTGLSGFHFTDEAIPPALAHRLALAIISSGETFSWWGNIRFEKAFTPQICSDLARSGCIAVTGGLECANDRLLKLMNKGITLDGAKTVLRNFADAGILVHAYLMYGFPSQTKAETMSALKYVRDRIREGSLHSAFWHRFALTTHSPISRAPECFGIQILSSAETKCRFAENEIFFKSKRSYDIVRVGKILSCATYNYMQGLGLDEPVATWERMFAD